MKCRKKPITINAWPIAELIEAATNNWDNLPKEVAEFYETGGLVFTSDSISIATLEGHMIGDRLSWLLQGVMDEFYPCKPDVFEATYDEVTA